LLALVCGGRRWPRVRPYRVDRPEDVVLCSPWSAGEAGPDGDLLPGREEGGALRGRTPTEHEGLGDLEHHPAFLRLDFILGQGATAARAWLVLATRTARDDARAEHP